ncbi:MAG: cardiolipin synthase [Oscillospiraceae bacterium]|nr:cardiolipin synthase [Oscillospiraceae bacterium]
MVIVSVSLLAQLAILAVMLFRFEQLYPVLYVLSLILNTVIIVSLINRKSDPAYKIAWIIPLTAVPVFGGLLYVIIGSNKLSDNQKKKMSSIATRSMEVLQGDSSVLDELAEKDPLSGVQSRYICDWAYAPVHKGTGVEYLPMGEVKFTRMLEELEKAKHYIFLEYFIIEQGVMWNAIHDILVRKAEEGVEVRLLYDDVGCIMTLPDRYDRQLEKEGIKASRFSPFVPVLTSRLNNRDHRKICVIDGHTAFTGGINLADEYINGYVKHGHWKDTAILLKGEAVWNLTVMFLSMWDYVRGCDEDFRQFHPSVHQEEPVFDDGYVQPFADSPLDNEPVGANVYLNMIGKASRYVYITTPYLILSDEMINALINAAKGGVDVRIITPHVPDKRYVHAVTRANYEELVLGGVKIYEYTPGFIHAKSFVADDKWGVVGTINLDYRSLYLHFECATWLCGCSCIPKIREDFLATQALSSEVTADDCRKAPLYKRFFRAFMRLFAPLM